MSSNNLGQTTPDPEGLPNIGQQEKTDELLARLAQAVDPRLEYVAGGVLFTGTAARALSHYFDDLTRTIGAETYERMMHDPEVKSCIRVLTNLVLAEGVTPAPSKNGNPIPEDDPEFEKALEIAEHCERNIRGLKSFRQTLEQMLKGLVVGNKVAEITLQVAELGPDQGKLVLKSIKPKPRRTTAFVVDAFMNVLGVVYAKPGTMAYAVGSFFSIDTPEFLADPKIMLPREKFFIFTNEPEDDDPRGQSMARPAYNAWSLKQQTWPEWLRWLVISAIPSLLGFLAEDSKNVPQVDPKSGVPQKDGQGNVIFLNPAQAMLNTLTALKNATAAVFPFGSKVDKLEVQGTGLQFRTAVDSFNSEITKGILGQTRATREARFGSKADSDTGEGLLYQIVMGIRAVLAEAIRQDLFKLLTRVNFGDEYLHLVPAAAMGKTEKRNFADDATAVAALQTSGYLDPSQHPALDQMMGLPKRTPQDPDNDPNDPNDPDKPDNESEPEDPEQVDPEAPDEEEEEE
ncbi:MAG: phage portal protein family protein [Blastocatellia bacterium]